MSIMFRDYGMLRFGIRSVEQNLPWVRRIVLLTNGQIPSWFNASAPRGRLVTHEEVFPSPQADLPTFNSNAIESHIHNIPGIASCILYLNDDFFIGRPTPKSYFVDNMDRFKAPELEEMKKNGWHKSVAFSNELINKWYHPNATSAVRHNYAGHYCYFFRKWILDAMWARWQPHFEFSSHNKFRDPKDVAVPFLHHNVALEEHVGRIEKGRNGGGSWRSNHTQNAELWAKIRRGNYHCVCIQDRLDAEGGPATEAEIDFLEKSLCELFPNPSSLEKTTDVNPCLPPNKA